MQYSGSPYPYQNPYYGPRTSMPHNPSPLINTPQPHGGYPGMPPGTGQWGTHHTPSSGYGTPPLTSGVPAHSVGHYSGIVSSNPPQSSSTRTNKQSKGQNNTLQPPKPPEKPLTPYMRYNKEMWDVVKGENPDLKLSEASKIIGTRWKMLSEKDKQKYADEWEAEKAVYVEQMKVYHNSPAYKAFLEAKHQAEVYQEAKQQAELAAKRQQVMSPGQMGLSMAQQEEEESEMVTMQQVAGARYLRNHRLMAEIFNDIVVPDNVKGSGDTKGSSLQEKVAALTQTQKDLEEELKTREITFHKRKRQIVQDGQTFLSEMKKLRESPLSQPTKKQSHPVKIPPPSPQVAKYINL